MDLSEFMAYFLNNRTYDVAYEIHSQVLPSTVDWHERPMVDVPVPIFVVLKRKKC